MSRPSMLFAISGALHLLGSGTLRLDADPAPPGDRHDPSAQHASYLFPHSPSATGSGRIRLVLLVLRAVLRKVGEPDLDLALGGLRGVGTVHQVLAVGQRQVAADRARGG